MRFLNWVFNNFEYFMAIISLLVLIGFLGCYILACIAIHKAKKQQEDTDNEQKFFR